MIDDALAFVEASNNRVALLEAARRDERDSGAVPLNHWGLER